MNPVRFNEPFETAVGDAPNPLSLLPSYWKDVPLFEYEIPHGEQKLDQIRNMEVEDLPKMPFKVWRIALTIRFASTEDGPGANKMHAVVVSDTNDLRDAVVLFQPMLTSKAADIHEFTKPSKCPVILMALEPVVSGRKYEFLADRPQDGEGFAAILFDLWVRGKGWFRGKHSYATNESLKSFCADVIEYLMIFCLDAMSPNVYTVEVRPTDERRSVEWVRARTHYTLITHGHPANSASVAQGARVTVDRTQELTRMAHNRRAHFKTLRHERYRFARGRRIFVRATWVGPKEWRDEGGKQIYRILEPVNQAEEAA